MYLASDKFDVVCIIAVIVLNKIQPLLLKHTGNLSISCLCVRLNAGLVVYIIIFVSFSRAKRTRHICYIREMSPAITHEHIGIIALLNSPNFKLTVRERPLIA